MRFRRLFALALCAWLPGQALAHDLQHEIGEGEAVSVRLFYADGSDFAFESYEVYRAGEEVPFQVGRTDLLGRVVFLPTVRALGASRPSRRTATARISPSPPAQQAASGIRPGLFSGAIWASSSAFR
jgi:hypothetical protein